MNLPNQNQVKSKDLTLLSQLIGAYASYMKSYRFKHQGRLMIKSFILHSSLRSPQDLDPIIAWYM